MIADESSQPAISAVAPSWRPRKASVITAAWRLPVVKVVESGSGMLPMVPLLVPLRAGVSLECIHLQQKGLDRLRWPKLSNPCAAACSAQRVDLLQLASTLALGWYTLPSVHLSFLSQCACDAATSPVCLTRSRLGRRSGQCRWILGQAIVPIRIFREMCAAYGGHVAILHPHLRPKALTHEGA